jgi:hypothetical protein
MKNSIKAVNKNAKTVSEYFGVDKDMFRHAITKVAAAMTSSMINPFDKRGKGDIMLDCMKKSGKDMFEVKDMNTAFVMGMVFSKAICLREELVQKLEEVMGKSNDKPAESMIPRMAEQDFADISKHIGAVGEQVKKLERQKVVN